MRENTPPASPFHGEEDDDDLVYVGDDIDEVIEHLEQMPDGGPYDEDGKMIHAGICRIMKVFSTIL